MTYSAVGRKDLGLSISLADGSDLFGEFFVFLTVQNIASAKKSRIKPSNGHSHVVQGILVENVQIEIDDSYVHESAMNQHLIQRIFGECVLVIKILGQRFCTCYGIGAV
jgi:hypothetical protein